MVPVVFDYRAPTSLAGILTVLREDGDERQGDGGRTEPYPTADERDVVRVFAERGLTSAVTRARGRQ